MLTPITLIPIEMLKPVVGTFPVVKIAEFMVPDSASGSGSRYFFAFSLVSPPRFSISWAPAGSTPNARIASASATARETGRFMGGSLLEMGVGRPGPGCPGGSKGEDGRARPLRGSRKPYKPRDRGSGVSIKHSARHPHGGHVRRAEAREPVGDPLERRGEVGARPLDRAEQDHEQVPAPGVDRGPERVGGRSPEGTVLVGEQETPGEVHALLADPGIAFPLAPDPRLDRAMDLVPVVEAERDLVFHRAQVAYVHRRVDLRQPLALEHPAQQRFAARAGLGGIEVQLVEQGPGFGDARDVGR